MRTTTTDSSNITDSGVASTFQAQTTITVICHAIEDSDDTDLLSPDSIVKSFFARLQPDCKPLLWCDQNRIIVGSGSALRVNTDETTTAHDIAKIWKQLACQAVVRHAHYGYGSVDEPRGDSQRTFQSDVQACQPDARKTQPGGQLVNLDGKSEQSFQCNRQFSPIKDENYKVNDRLSQTDTQTAQALQPEAKLPLAIGSFGFSPDTPGALIVPEYVYMWERGRGMFYCHQTLQNNAAYQRVATTSTTSLHAPSASKLDTTPPSADCNSGASSSGVHTGLPSTFLQDNDCEQSSQSTVTALEKLTCSCHHSRSTLWPRDKATVAPSLHEKEWKEAVRHVIEHMRAGQATKVVMARRVSMTTRHTIDIARVALNLLRAYPTCWIYCVDGLIGASPEMLADVDNGQLRCLVLAGTAPHDQSEYLMRSSKDRHEHALAVESVKEVLQAEGIKADIPAEPSILTLPNVCHLATDILAQCGQATSLQIASALHPTAAVCGTPRRQAAQLIERYENMSRGRYAGPVGWMDAEGNGQWAIALRGGQLYENNPRKIDIYAGGGIMPDSDPELELLETQSKMRPIMQAIRQADEEASH
ncbi:MAG: isochorismate synthase [Actinomycetaceae bacterium]|nr:isochorismate synthase [Actinomycetaceae bacterium]